MKTILIVDDQNSVLLTLEAILKKENYVVISCTNSIDAFENIQKEKFDLVITDAVMPMGTSGFSLIATIRKSTTFNTNVPIIMLTGKREATDVEKAIQVGANDYMIKPIDPDVLMAKVKKFTQKDEHADFVHAPVNQPASMPVKINITSTSEIGLKFISNVNLIPGQIYKISSDFFLLFEAQTVSVRVNSGELIQNQFHISANYVGLSEKELAQIRAWVRNKLLTAKNG